MYPNVHCSTIYNSQDMKQPKCPMLDEWIKKMQYIYTMDYYSAIKRNEIWSFVEMWMDLESVIQSEVSQKEKNKQHILMHICGKMLQMNLFVGQEQRCRRREWTCGHRQVGEGGTNWEIRFDINILPCVKQIASGNLLYSTGSSAQCSVMTQVGGIRGWEGVPRGRGYRYT